MYVLFLQSENNEMLILEESYEKNKLVTYHKSTVHGGRQK